MVVAGVAAGALGGLGVSLLADATLPARNELWLASLVLVVGWFGIDLVYKASRPPDPALRLGLVLAFGLLPVSAMLAAGPVWGSYGFLWPVLVLTPIALLGAISRATSDRQPDHTETG